MKILESHACPNRVPPRSFRLLPRLLALFASCGLNAAPEVRDQAAIRTDLEGEIAVLRAARAQLDAQIQSGVEDPDYLTSLKDYKVVLDTQIGGKQAMVESFGAAGTPVNAEKLVNIRAYERDLDALIARRVPPSRIELINKKHQAIREVISNMYSRIAASQRRLENSPLSGEPIQIQLELDDIRKSTQEKLELYYQQLVANHDKLIRAQEEKDRDENRGRRRNGGEGGNVVNLPLPPPPAGQGPETLPAANPVVYGERVHSPDNTTAETMYLVWQDAKDPADKQKAWLDYLKVASP